VWLRIEIQRTSADLTITRDGNRLERAAWSTPVPVDPGSHRIEVTSPGKLPWSATVEAKKEGETLTVEIPALVDDDRIQHPSSPWPAQRTAGLVIGIAGLAGLAIGGALGGTAAAKWGEAKPLCNAEGTCDPPGAALGNEARSLAHGSTAAFIAGGALAAAGVVLFLTAKSPAKNRHAGSAHFTPWVAPSGGGGAISLEF
jgi:hypothetical protein